MLFDVNASSGGFGNVGRQINGAAERFEHWRLRVVCVIDYAAYFWCCFFTVPEIITRSDKIALVPRRLVADRGNRIQMINLPLPVAKFFIEE